MLSNSSWKTVVAALACVGALSCKGGGDGGKGSKSEVSVSVDRIVAGAENLDSSLMSVKLKLENPTSEAVSITGVEWSVDTGDLAGVIKGESASGASLEAGQKMELEFKQAIKLPDDKDAYLAVIEKGSIPLTLKGAVKLGNGNKLGFDHNGAVATPTLPKFVVNDAQAARTGKDGLEATFFLRLINENQFSITIEAVEYAISVSGQEMKREQGGIGTRLVGNASQEFEVNVRFDEKSFKGTKAILAARKFEYTVKGQVELTRVQIPFEETGEIELGSGTGE